MTSEEIIEVFEELIKKYELKEVFLYPRDKFIEAIQTALTMLKAEPCEDAVSRKRVKYLIHTLRIPKEYEQPLWDGLDDLPPVTPKQRTGKWIPTQHFDEWYCPTGVCSNCGIEYIYGLPFCPACGAKMEGENEDKK